MNPNDNQYQELQNELVENLQKDKFVYQINTFNNLTSEKDKWNFINEARNSLKTKTEIVSLKNSFGDLVTNQKQIANLLNYRFSKLGDYLGVKRMYTSPIPKPPGRKSFRFQPINILELKKKHIKSLNVNKPLGPSNIPAWVLKDCMNMIAHPLCYMINTFISENKFPTHLKQAFVVPIFKKGDTEDPSNY